MSNNELQLFHEEMMQEEGLKVSDLPIELQKKIKGFNLMKGSHDKNPTEKSLVNLQKQSVRLGDAIQNFIENDFEEEEEEEEEDNGDDDNGDDDDKKPAKPKGDDKKPVKEKEEGKEGDDDKKPVKQRLVTTGGVFGNLMMEKKILAIMKEKGANRIKISDLESIIGKEPEYPEQQVNNIKLRKVFLSSDYRLV